jgi:hypothetical protein
MLNTTIDPNKDISKTRQVHVKFFQPLTTELGQKTARCESLWALLPYVEWDRFVTLAGSKSRLRVTLSYLVVIGTDWRGSCKSNYHTIMTTTAPICFGKMVITSNYITEKVNRDTKHDCHNTTEFNNWIRCQNLSYRFWNPPALKDHTRSLVISLTISANVTLNQSFTR